MQHDIAAVAPAREHHAWYPPGEASIRYQADDDDRREAEAREKPVSERPWDPFGTDLGDPGAISARNVTPYRPDRTELAFANRADRYLPADAGGEGKRDPMSKSALAEREAREMRIMRYENVDDFTNDRRVTSEGERYYKPVGSPTVRVVRDKRNGKRYVISDNAMRRPMRGPSNELRRWARPTENEAIRAVIGTGTNTGVAITMTRGMLMLWRQVHDVQVQRGKINDANLSKILAHEIARMQPGDTCTLTIYDRAMLRKFRGAPKRFRKGPFGEFLDYITRL